MLHRLIPTWGSSMWGWHRGPPPIPGVSRDLSALRQLVALHGTKPSMPTLGGDRGRGYPERLWRCHLGMILGNLLQLTLLSAEALD